ncbi:MAG: flagellar M-ring protein FliF [Candidatus Kapabacteria bacterium]|nr:flagellar M-ring protein FliF [Ignavibacteriota bacterium]MCW5886043.1 flagellar M-ring protein FliF [Candidatus Kapabacteria bacterium]
MADNDIQNQVKSFFGKLGIVQKAAIVIIPALVVFALAYFLISTGTKEQAVLFSGLEGADAGKITENLKERGIKYQIKDNGATITVDKNIVMDTRLALAAEGLPETSVVGYELFDQTNLGMSEFVQKLNHKRALEGELSKTIGSIEEIKKARVHIVVPERALFTEDQKIPTASVTLQLRSGRNLSSKIVEAIQTLVATSVEGMATNNVSVIDHKGKLLSIQDTEGGTAAGLTAKQLDQQRKVEEHLTNKAQAILDNVLGVGNSNVRLNAELDFTRIEQTKTDFDPDRAVIRSEQIITEDSKSTDSLYYLAVVNDRAQSNSVLNYEIPQNTEFIVHSVGHVKRLSVAAVVNSIPKVTENEGKKSITYEERSDEEMQKLTDIIKNAVGYDPARNDQITVNNIRFDTNMDEFENEIAPKLEWYEEPYNQKLMLLVGIILITVLLMYKFMQSKMIKERVRIAMELPGKAELSVDIDSEAQQQQIVDELNLDDNLMLLPSELPEQLLLEGESRSPLSDDNLMLESSLYPEKGSISKKGMYSGKNAQLDEENLMKLELRNKVQDFIDKQAEDAARLIRIMISQDPDERPKK